MTHLAFLVLFGLVGENNDLFALAVFKHLSAYRSTVNIGCTDFETVVAADCDYFIKSNIGIFVCCKLFDEYNVAFFDFILLDRKSVV